MAKPVTQQRASEYENMIDGNIDDRELESLYAWVDSVPLSRAKRNISRDFADGVLVAEIMHHFFPKAVELHNYTPANSSDKKKLNWNTLNRKVFPKLSFELAEDVINDLVQCKQGMIEKVLLMIQVKIRNAEYHRRKQSDKPEADQHQLTGRMTKVSIDDTKGSRFAKTKQEQEIKYEPVKKVHFKDDNISKNKNKKSTSRVENNPRGKGRKLIVPDTDLVPRLMLEEREQDLLAKDEMIKIMQAKVSRLEHLLHLKDMRIEDLQGRVESMRPTGTKK